MEPLKGSRPAAALTFGRIDVRHVRKALAVKDVDHPYVVLHATATLSQDHMVFMYA